MSAITPWGMALAAAALVAATLAIFLRVGQDYARLGKLRPPTAALQVMIFFLHGIGSYFFINGDPAQITWGNPLTWLGVALILVGLPVTVISMGGLGWLTSNGRQVSGLRQSGVYAYTRNPQILAYGLVVLGYALLWASWQGLLWVALYAYIAHVMVLTEEAHLRRVFGAEYAAYCAHAPRYLGLPRRSTK